MQTQQKKQRTKSRGNGTGTAYWSAKYRYWIAQAIVAWRIPEDESQEDEGRIQAEGRRAGILPDAAERPGEARHGANLGGILGNLSERRI